MVKKIENVAVIGAGVMGAQIAGHLAGCGFNVLLLDILPFDEPAPPETKESESWRNKIATTSLEKLKKSKPPALFTERVLHLITPGNIEDHLSKAVECDWIVEAVPEKLDIKRDLYSKLDKLLNRDIIISSNTSGISLSLLTEGRSGRFKKAFFITHFFNPVRYMKLVELVVGPDTSKENVDSIRNLLDERLGKGVVLAKDTPGFIANRIGIFSVMNTINKTLEKGWPIDLVDAVMGTPVSFARSAIFRTTDLVGLDTLLYVAKNTYQLCPHDPQREVLVPRSEVEAMLKEGRLGVKAGIGFYKKEEGKIWVFEPEKNEYREKTRYNFESLNQSKKIGDPAERVKKIFSGDDDAAAIAKELLGDVLVYVSNVAREISDSVVEVDNAMKWGYNWELGPFELWDAVGFGAAGEKAAGLISEMKKKGLSSFYRSVDGKKEYYDFTSGEYKTLPQATDKISVAAVKSSRGVLQENGGASLVDLGDGVVCCEFHSKMNSIDPDIIAMLNNGLDLLDAGNYSGMVIYNDGGDFSVGANLLMIAMAIGNQNWKQIEDLVRAFQDLGMRMRFSARPVVAAPFGRTLGGGCEICLASGNVIAATETYMGLVELGVGLIPAGGGCKNLLLRMEERRKSRFDPKNSIWFSASDGGSFPKVADAFETIAMAKVSISGIDAKDLGYVSDKTRMVIDREKLLSSAANFARELAQDYSPPVERKDIRLPGRGGEMALVDRVHGLRALGKITDYDVVLAAHLAHVLCGGNVAADHLAGEQDILDLEREVFLKLCGHKETADRIQHMLTTGKPLRN